MSGNILQAIAAQKKDEIRAAKNTRDYKSLQQFSLETPAPRAFSRVIQEYLHTDSAAIAVIAEIKKASPSRGVIREDFTPAALAQSYAEAGATALSVLTDTKYFQGDLHYLKAVKAVCSLPVLRKDFIIDPYQIYESRAYGADAVLLIAALLTAGELQEFEALAFELGLSVLVEIHAEEELVKTEKLKTALIGINNRDLTTFTVNLKQVLKLAPLLPKDKIIVCESGIHQREDIINCRTGGIRTFLIGESLMRSPDVGAALHKLLD